MGIYVNPGKKNYQMAVNSEIFVDKSEMIYFLNSLVNTTQRYVSVSRPRRFGKTLVADMICAYYDREDDRQLPVKSNTQYLKPRK
ncbi:Predicted AAA-ATPase [Lachnospiraceae bacterium KH1T2]|nr:Predicted AAA-ATPase [Lachnospiraceae bacterium KH1T2]